MSKQPDLTELDKAEQLTIEAVLIRLPRRSHINEIDRLERIERSLVDDEGPPTRPLRILNSED